MSILTIQIAVAGASLYVETRGDGPLLLLIPGGPADAGVFSAVAGVLSDRYKVVSYDPRGNSRSHFADEPTEFDMNVMGDDAAVIIAAFGSEAFVFGNSGGAQIALNLTARYPQLVRALIAHEPPCTRLLANHADVEKQMNAVVQTYNEQGTREGMAAFHRMVSSTPSLSPNSAPESDVVETAARIRKNFDYFLGQAASGIADYRPDLERLRASKVKMTVGLGRDSRGELANRTALALAEQLPAPRLEFPGGHGGFTSHPALFAEVLYQAFNA